ncbi:hypothetical protein HNP73_002676 [Amaricoccus macauensis]|uniref:YspA cpYpsA-related SLOG domain-containing protein n=1 Tax=Amaricoccus macauensis TaxID=57001 RepID=A0A840SPR5_9RHOB|nr:DUF2493 domain-containing protein [Amaricoccus macauensis]MBB5222740.1 hypothetical protein [Amaricoccus macauensis]
MRVFVCGGRGFTDRESLRSALDRIASGARIDVVIHGDAAGADRLAGEWARLSGIRELAFPADWERHGRAAGPIRNRRMLVEGEPDLVVAFPGGRGTANMMRQARAAGVPVLEPITASGETSGR